MKRLLVCLLLVGVVGCGESEQEAKRRMQLSAHINAEQRKATLKERERQLESARRGRAKIANLTACPDCEKEVSKRAATCPHCGSPLLEQASSNLQADLPTQLAVPPAGNPGGDGGGGGGDGRDSIEPLLDPAAPDLSSPEKALALYFGSRTWGERFQYTHQAVARFALEAAYRHPADSVIWPSGVAYTIVKMSNVSGEEIGVDITLNLKEAERLSGSTVYINGKHIDVTDVRVTCRYVLLLEKRNRTDSLEYRIDWESTRINLRETVRKVENNARVVGKAMKKSQGELKEIQTRLKWNLENAAISVTVVNIRFDRRVTNVYWKVTNHSRADISGVTLNIYVAEGDKMEVLDSLRIDNLPAGKTRFDVRQYANTRGGFSLRQRGWKAKIESLRLEKDGETLYAKSYFKLR
jgi:hypothetical protein